MGGLEFRKEKFALEGIILEIFKNREKNKIQPVDKIPEQELLSELISLYTERKGVPPSPGAISGVFASFSGGIMGNRIRRESYGNKYCYHLTIPYS